MFPTVHADGPPPGLVDVTTLPLSSTATHSVIDGQEMPSIGLVPSICASCHADAPPDGFVDVTTFPRQSTPAHRVMDGHDIPDIVFVSDTVFMGSTLAEDQEPAPPLGLVDVTTLPHCPPATQSDGEGHEIDWNWPGPLSTWFVVQAGTPAPGLAEASTFPESSAATQRPDDVHETPLIVWGSSMAVFTQLPSMVGVVDTAASPLALVATHNAVEEQETAMSGFASIPVSRLQLEAPVAGDVDVNSYPVSPSTATHRPLKGQEMAESSSGVTLDTVQADEPPVGFVEVTTFPLASTATQSVVEAHAIDIGVLVLSTLVVVQALAPPVGFVDQTTSPR
jgi:hypothetical protein